MDCRGTVGSKGISRSKLQASTALVCGRRHIRAEACRCMQCIMLGF
jgi:hypothetical protein